MVNCGVVQGESVEEFDSLFDYSRVQPDDFIGVDDDSDTSPPSKRSKTSPSSDDKDGKLKDVLRCDDEEEEDWLVPPPKLNNIASRTQIEEDSTLKELRMMKEELLSITKSAEDFLQDVDGSVKKDITSQQSSLDSAAVKSSMSSHERAKIVLSIQDKDGVKQFRIYMDDKFERLFKLYADKTKINLESLLFSFDGDKIAPMATPDSLGMEDNDIIEVRVRSS
ncbi:hypothetical protein SAY87_016368 [Trapa incisa]|uniref:Rad60/SUMO-like domain-containing protein n=1 Tax=Trapa incisa TaxID=236973 RepID=A0AAN7LHB0_9MYRT|nr:hypothetical protein SAY87_016368 [Trapa incisa]